MAATPIATATMPTHATEVTACLAFDKVGLVGRDKEIRVLLNAIENQQKKKTYSVLNQGPAASLPKDPISSTNGVEGNTCIHACSSSSSTASGTATSSNGSDVETKDLPPSPLPSSPVPNTTIASTAQNHVRSLVLISGQSGSGKSALVEQVCKSLLPQTACFVGPDQANINDSNNDTDAPFDGFFATGKCELSTKKEGVPYTGIQSAMAELCEQVANRAQSEVKASTEHQASTEGPGSKRQTLATLVSKGLSMGELALLSHVIPNIEMLTTVKTSQQAVGNGNPPGSATSATHPNLALPLPTSLHGVSDESVCPSVGSSVWGSGLSMNYKSHTQRITYVLRRFMQILCSYCPVVMAIDDLQWADRASLGLIQSWLLDSRSTSLTIIGLYRSNMLDENQTLKATLASLEESKRERSIRIIKLSVEDLSVDEVAVYLQRLFRVSSHEGDEGDHPDHSEAASSLAHLMPLAEIVHGKTAGNMFFIQQYLDSLVKDGLITQNHLPTPPTPPTTAAATLPEVSGVTNDASHAAAWAWDVNEITYRSAAAGDNIMDLMKMRLQKSASTHWVLSIAACLGATFSTSHVCAVITGLFIHSSHSKFFREVFQVTKIVKEDEIIAMLQTFDREALLKKVQVLDHQSSTVSDGSSKETSTSNKSTRVRRAKSVQYAFIHDKVQEAALSMIPTEDQLSELKYRVGEILLYALSENDLNDKIFMITNLLDTRPDLMPSRQALDRRMRIIMLNHKAGQQAASASAFHLASSYFALAIDLLPDDHWQTLSEESLELYSSAAESHLVITSFAASRSYCKAVINQNCGILGKVRAYHVLIDISFSETENTEEEGPVDMCLDLLSQLGCNLPSTTLGRMIYILRGIISTQSIVRRLEEDLRDTLSLSNDEHRQAVMKTLDKFTMIAYLSAPDLVPLITVKALRLSLKQGITMYSASALAFAGILEVCILERFDVAQKCGKIALRITKISDDPSFDGKTIHYHQCGIRHWNHPFEESISPMLEASRLSMSTGDVETGTWSLYGSLVFSLVAGQPLDSLDEDALVHSNTMRDFQQNLQYQLTLMLWQLVLNLRGASNHTTQLIGDAYNETNEAYDANHALADAQDMTRRIFQLYLAAYFGEHEIGSQIAIKSCLDWVKALPSSYYLPPALFHSALCCYGMAHKCKPSYYTKHARTFLKILKRWAKKGNPNCIPYIALLDAEKYSLKKQDKKAIEQYDEAIQMTRRQSLIHDQALVNERYSAFYARRGNKEKAKIHLEESINLYGQWGANKKVDMLLRQHKSDYA